MDAKQVWRAALGELQVSLSPANFETWLRDTQLVDVDEQRFRIAVPNGFAKDWLESRYRSLISQTLARIVGYSVQVEFVIGATPENPAEAQPAPVGAAAVNGAETGADGSRNGPAPRQQVRVEPTRVGSTRTCWRGGGPFVDASAPASAPFTAAAATCAGWASAVFSGVAPVTNSTCTL